MMFHGINQYIDEAPTQVKPGVKDKDTRPQYWCIAYTYSDQQVQYVARR